MTTRRAFLAGAGGAVAALPRAALAQPKPHIQTIRSTAKSWIWLAEDYATAAGFFARAGVDVAFTASGRGNNFPALAGSGIDIVLSDPGVTLPAVAQGFKARTIVQTVDRYASHVVVKASVLARAGVTEASPAAAKFAALKGLRMATTGAGSAPDNLLRWLAVQGGFDPNTQMRLVGVQGGGPGMIAALQRDVIDGFCLSSPTSDLAVARADCAYLFNMVTNPPPGMDPFCYIVASCAQRALTENREALVRYCMGIALALRAMNDDRPAFKAFAVPYLELDPAIADAAFAANGGIYFRDPTPNDGLFQRNIDFIDVSLKSQDQPPLPASLHFADVYDTSIVAEALRRLA
jgi:ABC-type nitrate/sulfonate/bicarbonate transport system substrate-binding protein